MNARVAQLPLRAAIDAAVVSIGDLAVRLPPQSPARGNDCLICCHPIGASMSNQVTIWPVMDAGCPCGNLHPATFLIHHSCPVPDGRRIIALAVARLDNDHPEGERCI